MCLSSFLLFFCSFCPLLVASSGEPPPARKNANGWFPHNSQLGDHRSSSGFPVGANTTTAEKEILHVVLFDVANAQPAPPPCCARQSANVSSCPHLHMVCLYQTSLCKLLSNFSISLQTSRLPHKSAPSSSTGTQNAPAKNNAGSSILWCW